MAQPMRVIDGSAKPYEPFWRFTNAEDSGSGEVELEFDGVISEYAWFGDEVTPKLFKDDLYAKGGGGPVTMLVNSPGGEVIAASVIRSILQEYPGKVTADIVGLAASAATIVVTGADHVRMRESALFMIHDPSGLAWGTIDEIKQFLGVLKTVKDSIVETYQTKTGMDAVRLGKMMTAETWMTAREAKELGFVDEVVTGSTKKPKTLSGTAGFANCLSQYLHVPAGLMVQDGAPVDEESAGTDGDLPSPRPSPWKGAGEEPTPSPSLKGRGEDAGCARDAEVESLGEFLKVFA
jgi:ATP-dependent protease ClpP protease subunit